MLPRVLVVLLAVLMAVVAPAAAVEPDEILPDLVLEGRARHISEGLRCLVCQNQSIDDSHAPLARDLRLLVRERLKAGDSDTAVRAYVVERYGDFVLLKPPFNVATLLLWLTPVALLLLAGGFAFRQFRTEAPRSPEAPLSAEEQRSLAHILERRD